MNGNINALADEIARELNLDAAAKRDALAGIPVSDSADIAGAESAVMQKARQKGDKDVNLLHEHCRQTREVIQECKRQMNASIDESGVAKPLRDALDGAKKDAAEASAVYNKFKVENGLERNASGDDRVAQILWAMLAVLLEGVLNSYFFASASERGLFGGFAAAFFIGIVNVSFAFVGGVWGLRYAKNHIAPFFKLCGLACFVFCCLVSAAMVSLATLYRGGIDKFKGDLELNATAIADHASEWALQNFFALDWGSLFSSIDSFILFFIGMLCAMFGVWKGYEFDDPYPGFGTMWRQKEAARIRSEEENEKHENKMEKWRRGSGDQIRRAMGALKDSEQNLRLQLGGMKTQCGVVENAPDDAASLAKNLLDRYRAMNKQIRAATSPPPPHFNESPSRSHFPNLVEQCNVALHEAKELGAESESVLKECEAKQVKLQRMLDSA